MWGLNDLGPKLSIGEPLGRSVFVPLRCDRQKTAVRLPLQIQQSQENLVNLQSQTYKSVLCSSCLSSAKMSHGTLTQKMLSRYERPCRNCTFRTKARAHFCEMRAKMQTADTLVVHYSGRGIRELDVSKQIRPCWPLEQCAKLDPLILNR